jgi:hypothetical protein
VVDWVGVVNVGAMVSHVTCLSLMEGGGSVGG